MPEPTTTPAAPVPTLQVVRDLIGAALYDRLDREIPGDLATINELVAAVAGWALPAHERYVRAQVAAEQAAPNPSRTDIFGEINAERERQIAKWGEQHRADDTGGRLLRDRADVARTLCQSAEKHTPGGAGWRAVLAEEVAEAFAESDPAKLRAELVQSAAVIVAWVEDIDSREAATGEQVAQP
jgi:hypothetical protein